MEFGFFTVQYNEQQKEVFYELLNSDFINVFLVGDKENGFSENSRKSFEEIHKAGKKCFVYFYDMTFVYTDGQTYVDVGEEFSQGPRTVIKKDWKENLKSFLNNVKDKDYYECIEGFYIDEPLLCGIRLEDFKTVTGGIREMFPDKRIFCCFSVAGVAPDIWTLEGIPTITEDAGQYLTDVSFDMYHAFDEKYSYITSEMKRRLGNRKDLRIWQVPCIMNYRGDKTEDHAVKHLNGLYELLKNENNPGGLMCYTYYVHPGETESIGNIGLSDMRGLKQGDVNWSTLWSEIVRIGKEVCKK